MQSEDAKKVVDVGMRERRSRPSNFASLEAYDMTLQEYVESSRFQVMQSLGKVDSSLHSFGRYFSQNNQALAPSSKLHWTRSTWYKTLPETPLCLPADSILEHPSYHSRHLPWKIKSATIMRQRPMSLAGPQGQPAA
ncbi:hypothetical protein VTP01DRAFT_10356 [Rhizomucor pusillus]|uniref:uncharacterized protein n=1 Tax=Rhizomucor pusillus TaxID=4840 RepID=UPI003742238C